LIVAQEVRDRLGLAKVVLVPARIQPHKPPVELADPEHRLAMVRLAANGDPGLDVSDIELRREGPSYTIDTVRQMREAAPDDEFYFIIGSDTISELPAWKEARGLAELCRFVVVNRPGWRVDELRTLESVIGEAAVRDMEALRVETPPLAISSTDIRRRIQEGRPIRYMVPPSVTDYIERHAVYR